MFYNSAKIASNRLWTKFFIDYGTRINKAILDVIKEILKDLSKSKISSNHCFYITFKTKSNGVVFPNYLKKDYPNEMTVVLQDQFWDLKIKKMIFLFPSYLIKKENIIIPFHSIIKFYDPFVKFSIQLDLKEEKKLVKKIIKKEKKKNNKQKIVSLADFRKKDD